MVDISPRLSGEEWQLWANQLLGLRYGPAEYQRVPDNQRGDAGIEGFAICGHAYQAYGPEEPLTTSQRFMKHQKKMTDDIRKFIDNKDIISAIVGNVKMQRWVLLVPYFDGQGIVKHASKKTEEVIAANLPYVDNKAFRVIVEDEEDFSVERTKLLDIKLSTVSIIPDNVPQPAIAEWASKHDTLVQTLDDKASRIPTLAGSVQRRQFRDRIIKHYLEGQNVLEELRKYPTAYETIRRAKSERERYLATEVLLETGSPPDVLHDALENIKNTVKNEVQGISEHTVDAVAWEAISDWLIRCPLDFPKEDTNA